MFMEEVKPELPGANDKDTKLERMEKSNVNTKHENIEIAKSEGNIQVYEDMEAGNTNTKPEIAGSEANPQIYEAVEESTVRANPDKTEGAKSENTGNSDFELSVITAGTTQ